MTFHLAKLVEAGLVEVVPAQKRLGVRGRPSQSYRLTGREVAASVPDRRYDLLAGVLLEGVAQHQLGETAQDSAERVAHDRGRELAQQAIGGRAPRSVSARLTLLGALLTSLGYVPRRDSATITVRNCPFDKFRTRRRCAPSTWRRRRATSTVSTCRTGCQWSCGRVRTAAV